MRILRCVKGSAVTDLASCCVLNHVFYSLVEHPLQQHTSTPEKGEGVEGREEESQNTYDLLLVCLTHCCKDVGSHLPRQRLVFAASCCRGRSS